MSTLLEYCRGKEKVICYGAGLYGKIVCAYLIENGVRVDCFAVTNNVYPYETVLGKRVKQIDNCSFSKTSGIIVCGNSTISIEMRQELLNRGISDFFVVDDEIIEIIDASCEYNNSLHGKKGVVLLYHRVCNIKPDIWKLANSPDSFRKQVEYLKDNFNVVRYEDIFDLDLENTIAITFDDGYADNYYYALPILEELQIPATIFVCSGNIDSEREFWWDALERMLVCNSNCPPVIEIDGEKILLDTPERRIKACYSLRERILKLNSRDKDVFLEELEKRSCDNGKQRETNRSVSSEELKNLDKSPWITIGAHTVTHTRMSSQKAEDQFWEINTSQKCIEEIIGHGIDYFSYPFGGMTDYNMDSIAAVKSAGFKKAAAVQRRYAEVELINYNHGRIGIQGKTEGSSSIRELRRAITLGG